MGVVEHPFAHLRSEDPDYLRSIGRNQQKFAWRPYGSDDVLFGPGLRIFDDGEERVEFVVESLCPYDEVRDGAGVYLQRATNMDGRGALWPGGTRFTPILGGHELSRFS